MASTGFRAAAPETERPRSWHAAVAVLVTVAATAVAAVPEAAAAAKQVPLLSGRVVDEAGLLSAAARQRIEGELAALERETGDQVAVLMVQSLGGEPLEEYSVKVAHTWKLGQKGKDNGILLLISRDDHKLRIEVGYGLEGTLTDLRSNEIVDQVIRPRFRQGDLDGGVEQGVDAIVKVLHGQPLPARPAAPARGEMPIAGRIIGGLVFLVVVGVFSLIALFMRRGRAGSPPAAHWRSGFLGGLATGMRMGPGGGFSSGGSSDASFDSSSSDSGSSDSSSSDSSFSGGGGDFGGGGASGDW